MDNWTGVDTAPLATIEAAKDAAKQLPPYKWKWHRKAPGDGVSRAVMVCNAHKGCTRMVMVKKMHDGFRIFEKGEHTSEINNKPRTNSTLTFDALDALKVGMSQGARPSGILVSLTLKREQELKTEGKDPLQHKKDKGGLEGLML